MRIIGIDPGLRRLGWGVVERHGSRLVHVANGACPSGNGTLGQRLATLHEALSAVIAEQRPDAAAIEKTFVNTDPAGALILGQARGVALLALAQAGLPIAEFAPNAVKKAVVGAGRAEKTQVAAMVAMLLPGARATTHDAWDALAIAITRANRSEAMVAP